MDSETQKAVILIVIGAAIGLLPTWINFLFSSWVAKIKQKTGIVKSYKLALAAYVTEIETIVTNVPLSKLESIQYLKEVYQAFRNNLGLFNKYEIFYFFWHMNLFLGTENIIKEFNKDLLFADALKQVRKKADSSFPYDLNVHLAKGAYEFLCFAEKPLKRPFAYFWFKLKKMTIPNVKAIDQLMIRQKQGDGENKGT